MTAGASSAPDPDAAAAQALKQELETEGFDITKLTPDRLLTVAKQLFPERLGTAVWVSLKTGSPEEGATIQVFRVKDISADVLLGHAHYGASLGYQFAQSGNLSVSVFAGAEHSFEGNLTQGWEPVAGLKIRF